MRSAVRNTRPLLLAGLLTEGVYLMLAARLPWWRYGGAPQSWAKLLGEDGGKCVFALGVIGLLMALYVWGMRFAREGDAADRRVIWLFAFLFSVTLLWLLPVTSDLFAYLCQAHMVTDLGVNPLLQAPAEVADSLLLSYPLAYGTRPTVYGPAWILVSAVGTAGRYDLPLGLLYLKGLAVAAYLSTAWLVERILLESRPEMARVGLYFFAWNPLVLLMAVGDGHNDIVLVALVLLALLLLLRERWALSFGALTVSVWVKYVSLVLVPLFVVYLWRRMAREERSNLLGVATRGGLAVTSSSLVVAAPLVSLEALEGMVKRFLQPLNWHTGAGEIPAVVLRAGLCLYCLAYLLLLVRFWRGSSSFQDLAGASFLAFLFAFILGAARSQPWHLLWAVGVAGLSKNRWAERAVVAMSGLMLAAQVGVEWGIPWIC